MTIANFNLPSHVEEMVVNCGDDELHDSKYDEVPPVIPSFEEQKNIIRDATKSTLNVGDMW